MRLGRYDDLIFVSFRARHHFDDLWVPSLSGTFSREIWARRSAEMEAQTLARHDPLTGLPNRRFFAEKLDEYLRDASATQRGRPFSCVRP